MAEFDVNGYDFNNDGVFGDGSSKIKNLAVNLNGNITDFLLCDYSDKQFLIITQFMKIGSLIFVSKGQTKSLDGTGEIYDVKTYCGVDDQEYHLVTRYLAEQLEIKKPILFGICLKDKSLEALKAIVNILKENNFF